MSATRPTEHTNEEAVKAEKKAELKAAKKAEKKRRRARRGRRLKKLIKFLLLLVILAAAALFGLKAYIQNQYAGKEDEEEYARAAVMRGAMNDTVYGTGTTSAKSQPSILAQTEGTLTDLRVEIGDTVKEGDILAVITNEDIDDAITDYEFAIWDLDERITGTMNANVYNITSPVKGRVMAVYAGKGDDALAIFRRYGTLAVISTDGRMKVELSDIPTSMGIQLGDRLQVRGMTVNETGTVTDLTLQGTHAVVTVIGDKFPMGEEVEVLTEGGEFVGAGTLEPNKPMGVSSYGGTISKVHIKVGDTVTRKSTIFSLDDSPLSLDLESIRLEREAAAKDLEDAKAQRENLIVLAPCDGVVASLEVAEGDKIESGKLIGSILEGEDMKLTIAVDELDVVEVKVGQKVTITIDALSGSEFTGEVYKIAPVGSNSGGVTTYNVELAFEAEGSGVRSGMNATGEIEIAATADTLYVPVEAIMTINDTTYVMVEDGGNMSLTAASGAKTSASGQRGSRGGNMPGGMPDMGGMPQFGGEMPDMSSMPQFGGDNASGEPVDFSAFEMPQDVQVSWFTRLTAGLMAWLYEGVDMGASKATGSLVQVEVGMQNDDYAEILSGVSEGQVVLYTGEEETTSFWGGSRGGMGGMGGMGGPMGF